MIHFSTTSLILHYTDVEAYYKDIIFFDVSVYLTLSNQTESDRQTDRQKSHLVPDELGNKSSWGVEKLSLHCNHDHGLPTSAFLVIL